MEIGDIPTPPPELNRAPFCPLEKMIGGAFYGKIDDGQDVQVGRQLGGKGYYLRCDFNKIEEAHPWLKELTPQKLDATYAQDKNLETSFPGVSEPTRKLCFGFFQACSIARNILQEPLEDRDETFKKFAVGEIGYIKPLSLCQNESACVEYSVLTSHLMRKMGIATHVIVGTVISSDGDVHCHTYLTTEDGAFVLDPAQTALNKNSWPIKIYETDPSSRLTEDRAAKPVQFISACKGVFSGSTLRYGS